MNVQSKCCSKCKVEKPLSDFYRASKERDEHQSSCKACCKKQFDERWKNDKGFRERHRQTTKTWRKANPDKVSRFNKKYDGSRKQWRRERLNRSPRAALAASRSSGLHRRPTQNPITILQLIELWEVQKGLCAVSGIEMTWGKGDKGKAMPTSVSLDRIDNSRSYEPGNVRLICHAFNCFRGQMDDEQMYAMALALVRFRHQPNLRVVK